MIRKRFAVLLLLCLTSMLVFAQTNTPAVSSIGATAVDVKTGLSAKELYEMLTIATGWAIHANWGKILAAYEWVGDQGGVWGILCRFLAGKKPKAAPAAAAVV